MTPPRASRTAAARRGRDNRTRDRSRRTSRSPGRRPHRARTGASHEAFASPRSSKKRWRRAPSRRRRDARASGRHGGTAARRRGPRRSVEIGATVIASPSRMVGIHAAALGAEPHDGTRRQGIVDHRAEKSRMSHRERCTRDDLQCRVVALMASSPSTSPSRACGRVPVVGALTGRGRRGSTSTRSSRGRRRGNRSACCTQKSRASRRRHLPPGARRRACAPAPTGRPRSSWRSGSNCSVVASPQ